MSQKKERVRFLRERNKITQFYLQRNGIALYTDASIREDMVTFGGVLLDESGCWIMGYVRRLGNLDILSTELWSILWGLKYEQMMGLKQIDVYSGSLSAVNFLKHDTNLLNKFTNVVNACRERLCQVLVHPQ